MLLLCSVQVHGQTSRHHVYEDSSILYPSDQGSSTEVIEAPVQEDVQEVTDEAAVTESAGENIPDTSLGKNSNTVSQDSITILKNTKPFAYAKNLDSLLIDLKKKQQAKAKEKLPDAGPSWLELFFTSGITRVLFWGLAIFFICFIIVKLFLSGGFFRGQTTKSRIPVVKEDDNIPVADRNYDALILNAKKEQNYRLATRYLYLQLLQKLAAAGAIEFAADKTNSEYLRELSGKAYKQEISVLTLNYEYVWYGEFKIDMDTYGRLENRFKNVIV